MRRLLVLLALTLAALAAVGQQSFPAPTGYIDDYAQVLSPESKVSLELQANELHEKTRAQLFLLTIPSLNGADIKSFSNDLFHTWKVGEKGTDRGVLILFVIGDHKWRIEVGYGFEGLLNDARVGDIGRSLVPSLKAADYDAAAQQALASVAGMIAAESNVTLTTLADAPPPAPDLAADPTPQAQPDESWHLPGVIVFFAFFGFVGIFAVIAFARKSGSGSGSTWTGSTPSGSSSSGFFSSSSSSSSDSSSSSGSSGSSDDFSGGDGGDSGGGGADGSW